MATLVERFTELLGSEKVRSGEAITPELCIDESLTATAVKPAVVLTPVNTSEVAEVVRVAITEGWPITARGAMLGSAGVASPWMGGSSSRSGGWPRSSRWTSRTRWQWFSPVSA